MDAVSDRAIGTAIDQAEEELASKEGALGKDNPELVPVIEKLAELYQLDGLYAKAELMYKRGFDLRQKSGKPADVAQGLHSLALIYRIEGKLDDAEAIYLRAVATAEEQHGTESRNVADRLACLAFLYREKREFARAEELLTRALSIYEKTLGAEGTQHGMCCLELALLCCRQDKMTEAKSYAERSLMATAGQSGEKSDAVALTELIQMYYSQNRFEDAEILVRDALASDLESLWPTNPLVADIYQRRAEFFRAQSRFVEAEKLFKKALDLREKALGLRHPELACTAMNLASMYLAQGRYADAEPMLKFALKIRVAVFGVEHPGVAACVESYASLLKKTKRQNIANKLETRAREIRSKLVWLADRANSMAKQSS